MTATSEQKGDPTGAAGTAAERRVMARMRETLQQGLSAQRGRPVAVRELHEEPFGSVSSFPVKRLRVVLDDGEALAVFFKDLNPLHQVIEARSVRPLGLQRSRREVWMYSEVLDAERLGTPRFCGHRWEPGSGLLWLFLEDVGPRRLRSEAELDLWVAAVRWLATFHATMEGADLDRGMLAPFDSTKFRRPAEQLAGDPPDVSGEQRALIRRALDIYEDIVDSLDQQPRGIIHGEFVGKNVVIRSDSVGHPIAVIDWETAGYGPLYRDLTDITAGSWTREQRMRMWRAYYEQYCRDSGRELSWGRFYRDASNMALAQALGWLAWWSREKGRRLARSMREVQRIVAEMSG